MNHVSKIKLNYQVDRNEDKKIKPPGNIIGQNRGSVSLAAPANQPSHKSIEHEQHL